MPYEALSKKRVILRVALKARSRRIYAPKICYAKTIMRRSFDYALKAPLRMTEGSEICCFGVFELELELVCDQRDEFRIGGFSLGAADGVAKEALQGL